MKYSVKPEDVKDFLRMLGYDWTGMIKETETQYVIATGDDFNGENVELEIMCDSHRYANMSVYISPANFIIEHYEGKDKQYFIDHPEKRVAISDRSYDWKKYQLEKNPDYKGYILEYTQNELKNIEIQRENEKKVIDEKYRHDIKATQNFIDEIISSQSNSEYEPSTEF